MHLEIFNEKEKQMINQDMVFLVEIGIAFLLGAIFVKLWEKWVEEKK